MKSLLALVGFSLLFSLTVNLASAADIKYSSTGFAYMTGGIGEEERAVLKQHQKQFNLHLVFSIGDSEAATNVDVRIFDMNNALIYRLLDASPRLNIRLPADSYSVVASRNGVKQSHHFTLEDNEAKQVILNWKETDSAEALTDKELTTE